MPRNPQPSYMSIRTRARSLPYVAGAFRSLRRTYRGAFRFFPLSWSLYLRFGGIRPIDAEFGLARGQAIDRYYIETFLDRYRGDIRGRVLEIRDDSYTRRFGHALEHSDVLDLSPTNERATVIGDLTHPSTLGLATYDCAIVTQTLQLIYDVRAAVDTLHRALKPGGVLLVTLPGISKIAAPTPEEGTELYQDCWRFTRFAARKLFEEFFPSQHLEILAFGNVLASVGFLHGVSAEEIGPRRLDRIDDEYQLVIAVRAVKPTS
jgi:SAM-dependent methyltransferase